MKLPEVWGETPGMVWHRALETFLDAANTACGKYTQAWRFQTGRPTHDTAGEHRPKLCNACR